MNEAGKSIIDGFISNNESYLAENEEFKKDYSEIFMNCHVKLEKIFLDLSCMEIPSEIDEINNYTRESLERSSLKGLVLSSEIHYLKNKKESDEEIESYDLKNFLELDPRLISLILKIQEVYESNLHTIQNKKWIAAFKEYFVFVLREKQPPSVYTKNASVNEKKLANWAVNQRRMSKKSSFPLWKNKLFKFINFDFDPNTTKWEKNFIATLDFINKNGFWPKKGKSALTTEERSIGEWCDNQRQAFINGNLSESKIELLADNCFDFYIKDANWRKNLCAMQFYNNSNKNEKRDIEKLKIKKIYLWRYNQNKLAQEDKLIPWRKRALDGVGFFKNKLLKEN